MFTGDLENNSGFKASAPALQATSDLTPAHADHSKALLSLRKGMKGFRTLQVSRLSLAVTPNVRAKADHARQAAQGWAAMMHECRRPALRCLPCVGRRLERGVRPHLGCA